MNSCDLALIAEEVRLENKFAVALCRFVDENPRLVVSLEKEEQKIKRLLLEDAGKYESFMKDMYDIELYPILNLYFAVVFAEQCKSEYKSRGIDPAVYRDTMSDINIWARSNYNKSGEVGLMAIGWIATHLSFRIFRLDRLQFEMKTLEKKVKEYPACTPCLDIHIPEGEKLNTKKCQSSIEMAKDFFSNHFEESYPIATCHSWLLHESLREIMEEDSNIVRFASLFEVIENNSDKIQALERVFGDNVKISDDMPESTSLQRKMKRFLLDGGQVGMGYGIIEL